MKIAKIDAVPVRMADATKVPLIACLEVLRMSVKMLTNGNTPLYL